MANEWEDIGEVEATQDDGWEDVGEVQEPVESEEMGAGEAALTGFGEGASFGLAPVISGAVSAAGEVVEDVGDVLGLTTESELRDQGFDIEDPEKGLAGLAKAYYEGREAQRRQQEKAFEDQPAASLAGNIAGGITSLPGIGAGAQALSKGGKVAQTLAKALPKAESVKGLDAGRKAAVAFREGGKAGAIAGLGSGEERLLGEDKSLYEGLEDVAQETAETALGGAVLGGAASGIGSLTKGLAKGLLSTEAFSTGRQLGKEGIKLTDEAMKNEVSKLAEDIRSKAGKVFKAQGMNKANALDYADEIGIRVNAGEEINEVLDDIIRKGATSIEDQAEKTKFIRSMQGLQGELTPEIDALNKLDTKRMRQEFRLKEKGFDKVSGGVEDVSVPEGELAVSKDIYVGPKNKEITRIADQLIKEPEIALKQFDMEKMSLSELDQVINEINRHTGDLTGPAKTEVEKKARILAGNLRNLSNEAIEDSGDLAEANLKLSRIFSAMERAGVKGNLMTESRIQKDKQIDKLRQLIQSGGDVKEMDRERFFQYLGEAAPEHFTESQQRADLLQKGLELTKRMGASKSFNLQGLLGSAEGLVAKGAHKAGNLERGARKAIAEVPQKAAARVQETLYKMAPDQVRELSSRMTQKFGEKASAFAGPLERAANSEGKARTAIMYGLYQQPAFRHMLGNMGETFIGDEEEDVE